MRACESESQAALPAAQEPSCSEYQGSRQAPASPIAAHQRTARSAAGATYERGRLLTSRSQRSIRRLRSAEVPYLAKS